MLDQLGFQQNDRLLIINADDFGLCHATNLGIQQLLVEGAVSSATVMMPCSWAREAVRWSSHHPHLDVGVHLTLTSEWENYKWGPVTVQGDVSSLVTNEGYFPSDTFTFEQQANTNQVWFELKNQIEKALAIGLDPTHLDNHMGSLYGLATGRHFFEVVFELCAQYRLPFRVPRSVPTNQQSTPELEALVKQVAAHADHLGIAIIDELLGLPFHQEQGETYESFKHSMIQLLRNLKPGISELIIHPSLVTDELKAINPYWEKRGWEFQIFRDPDIRKLMASENIKQIRWRDLRNIQRADRKSVV